MFTDKPTIVDSQRILYTASSFARTSLLHLQEVGSLTALAPHTSSRENLPSYLFFMVVSGSGSISYNKQKYALSPGDCVFIDCSHAYSHSTPSALPNNSASPMTFDKTNKVGEKIKNKYGEGTEELWSLKWIHFNGSAMSSIYTKYLERGGRPVFRPKSSAPFFGVFDEMFDTAGSDDYMRDMRINSLLSQLMLLIMSESWHPEERKAAPKRQCVQRVKEYIDENFKSKITLEELSSTFFIDKYYLTKSFKAQVGSTISAYLINVRITHSKQLLRFSDKSIEEIAEEVGISDPAYFSRLFRKVEGVNPSEYRERW